MSRGFLKILEENAKKIRFFCIFALQKPNFSLPPHDFGILSEVSQRENREDQYAQGFKKTCFQYFAESFDLNIIILYN